MEKIEKTEIGLLVVVEFVLEVQPLDGHLVAGTSVGEVVGCTRNIRRRLGLR